MVMSLMKVLICGIICAANDYMSGSVTNQELKKHVMFYAMLTVGTDVWKEERRNRQDYFLVSFSYVKDFAIRWRYSFSSQ